MDVVDGNLGLDEARVGGVGEDVGVGGGQVPGEVARVEDIGELGAAVEAVGPEVAVQLGEGGELGVGRGSLVCVGALDRDAHHRVAGRRGGGGGGGGGFEQGSRCEVMIT